ncbi:hypothetical protein GCM10009826_46740 [Humibacillus xanthopallidus]
MSAVFSWALDSQSYNVWGAILVTPMIILLNLMLIRRVTRGSGEPWLPAILSVALAAKIVGALVRYLVAYGVYGGAADAERYNVYAAGQYGLWRQGFVVWDWGSAQGTQYMELITTAIYTVIGPSPLAGFLVFGSFAFWGQYLLFRAFRISLPEGDGRRYALLVLLLPSLLYWPSSIGKESWLMLFVGVTALGAAKMFVRQRGALGLLAVGAVGTTLIRPHIAVLLFAGVLVAQLFRPSGSASTDILRKVGGIAILGGAAYVISTKSATFLGIDDFNWQALSETVTFRSEQTVQGGSEFSPVPLTSVTGIPAALATVLFRPFTWEAHSVQLLVQSLEGFFLLILTVRAWPQLRGLPKLLRHNPYVVFSVVYTLAFMWAFSGLGNFGILARQRVLMIPFFLVLLCLPARRKVSSDQLESEFYDAHR